MILPTLTVERPAGFAPLLFSLPALRKVLYRAVRHGEVILSTHSINWTYLMGDMWFLTAVRRKKSRRLAVEYFPTSRSQR